MAWYSARHRRQLLLRHLQYRRLQAVAHGGGIGLDITRFRLFCYPHSPMGFGSSDSGQGRFYRILQQWRLAQSRFKLSHWTLVTSLYFTRLVGKSKTASSFIVKGLIIKIPGADSATHMCNYIQILSIFVLKNTSR